MLTKSFTKNIMKMSSTCLTNQNYQKFDVIQFHN